MIDNNQHITYNVNLITDLWSTTNSEIFLNFIDFIKGFIPLKLSQWLTQFNLKQNDITQILNDIWIPRCDRVHEMEKMMGITNIMKRTKPNEVFIRNFTSSSSSISSFYNNINIDDLYFGLRQKIYYGGDLLDFTLHVNHVL